jgi:Acyl-CoA reductase (LuxC)
MSTAHALHAAISAVSAAGDVLWAAGDHGRARWLADAFALLADPESALGRRARTQLPATSGLSGAMVEWGLSHSLAGLDHAQLCALAASVPAPHGRALRVRPGRLCAVVLSGNVFTAVLRAALWPLLLGWPVLAKASSRDDTLPQLLAQALTESDPRLGSAFAAVTFAADQAAALAALLAHADAVSVFGSDATVAAVRAQLRADAAFQGHGHGLGAAFVGGAALQGEAVARAAAQAFADDVAAYDQRGCMSPHAVWVEAGAPVSPEGFGRLLHEALGALAARLPRGPLPFEAAAQELSYRGVAAVVGTLREGASHAVAVEEHGVLRVSPGHRNVQVLSTAGPAALCAALAPLGVHLKCLGVAGIAPEDLLAGLPPRLAPRICPLGHMQRPPPHALTDGVPAWEGLVRYAEL